MKRLFLTLFSTIIYFTMQGSVHYAVTFPKPETHYARVEMSIDKPSGTFTDFVMPVWTPGSYKVREFARNVEQFTSAAGEKVSKINKNTWRVTHKKGVSQITISYLVYAFEYTVRTSYIDQYQAFLHGVSVFMYADNYQNLPCYLTIKSPDNWKKVTVALPKDATGVISAGNYDLLVDSPIALGNHETAEFTVAGVKHTIAMLGEGNYDMEKLKKDFTKIVQKEFDLFGEHPSPEYVIFIQNVETGGGGLEHLNSQTSVIYRWGYNNPSKYKNFLALIAHEYFHLWNVKRIRPIELGPFDYNKEVYTNMLWVAEGITSYYDDLFIRRCEFYNEEEYLGVIATAINRMENLHGNKVQTLAMSSFDAWIKLYLPDENSDNSSISYYQKGMLVALVLDLEIIKRSNGTKKLDDVMRYLYKTYYKEKGRGFTENEFAESLKAVTGSSFDDILQAMIYRSDAVNYNSYLNYVGLELQNQPSNKFPMGITTKVENGKTLVKYVELDKPGSKAGLSVNDEIIAINGLRVNGDLDEFIATFKEGEKVDLIVSRLGKIITLTCVPEKDTTVNYKVVKIEKEQSEAVKALYNFWIK